MTTATVRRRYVALAGLRQIPTGLALPLFVLLPTARGLSPAQVGLLLGAFSATTLVLELPTGGLADVLGARPVLLAAAALATAAAVVVALAASFVGLLAGFVLYGVARALDSGPLQSWFVSTVRAATPDAPVRSTLAHAGAAGSAAIAAGALATAAITALAPLPRTDAAVLAASAPLLVAALVLACYGVLVGAWVMDHAPRERRPVRAAVADVPRALGSGLALATRPGRVRRLVLYTGALGAALTGVEFLTPLHLQRLVAEPADAAPVFAALAALAFGAAAAGSLAAPLLARALGSPQAALVATTLVGAGALAGIGAPSPMLAAALYLGFYALLGMGDPLMDELTHDAVASAHRTTVLSIRSMALQAVGMVTSVGAGWLSGHAGVGPTFAVVAVAFAVGPLAFRRWSRLAPGAGATADAAHSPQPAGVSSDSGT